MLRIKGDRIAKKELIVLDKSTNSISNFFGSRIICNILVDEKDKKMIEDIFIKTIRYIADVHSKNLFHGDIKDENIFYDEND